MLHNMLEIKKIVEKLISMQKSYRSTYRWSIVKEKYKNLIETGIIKKLSYKDITIRESLMEHVWHIPIIASFIWPYLQNKNKVDLWKSLIMLSIHDIWEIKTGDTIIYKKTQENENKEIEEASLLLNSELLDLYKEMIKLASYEAKFATSIDMLAPLLLELESPELHIPRRKFYGFNLQDIISKKRKMMKRDKTLLSIFDYRSSIMKEHETQT